MLSECLYSTELNFPSFGSKDDFAVQSMPDYPPRIVRTLDECPRYGAGQPSWFGRLVSRLLLECPPDPAALRVVHEDLPDGVRPR